MEEPRARPPVYQQQNVINQAPPKPAYDLPKPASPVAPQIPQVPLVPEGCSNSLKKLYQSHAF